MSKKICLLTDSLSSGGAEMMVSNLSISLSRMGYELVVVSMKDEIVYPYLGELFNFGKIKNSNNKLYSFLSFKSFFKKQNFDVIIDHRVRKVFFKELIFSKLIFRKSKIVYCVHGHCVKLYFPLVVIPTLSKLTLVKNKKIVAVSKEIQYKLKQKLKLKSEVIHNYVISEKVNNANFEFFEKEKYIIAVGRLEKVKQFDVLIKCFKSSKLSQNGIKLLIFGEGQEKAYLNNLIKQLNLDESVVLKGFRTSMSAFIKSAKALVLTSQSEGFPMVLLEALELKTPVVSFNCKSGPDEIIIHEENGLLVKNQSPIELTKALNKLLLDEKYYNIVKGNLIQNPSRFSEEKIIQKWVCLLHDFIK